MDLDMDIAEIDNEISLIEDELRHIRAEAEEDGVIDDEEQSMIDEVTSILRNARHRRTDLVRASEQFKAREENTGDGGFLSGILDTASEFVEDATDTVKKVAETAKAAAESVDPSDSEATDAGGTTIAASVGKGGKNDSADVKVVQTFLNKAGSGLKVDGAIGPKTIGAITRFQEGASLPAVGKVEPGDATWVALSGGLAGATLEAAEEAGKWLEDTVGSVGSAISDAVGGMVDAVLGDDERSLEALEAILDEYLELEKEAEDL